ncbi:hypothetical protein JSE7799_00942 [Jannaschia seosinensis]|uniref:Lipoprotein n=1 Tax=Jannaschia seosinensis TaxID=313367 RepID=A0A0M7B624_9RHOB|nr:hypothetical protein [Jannaschia seosinensis]CUH32517.1 hypothetical protein JSE7799_00942 [Jannaschia seosinensis]
MKIALPMALGLIVALAGCDRLASLSSAVTSPFRGGGGLRGTPTTIDGMQFRTRIRADDDDPRAFTAVTPVGQNFGLAVEAGRTQAIAFCLERFGGSDIAWFVGPDRPLGQIAVDQRGAIVLSGQCVTR